MEKDLKPKGAYTLAEVLITLGIIGIVASLTLPALIQRKIEKSTIVKLQKFTSTFENAFNMAIAEYGPVSQWFEGDVSQAGDCHEVWNKIIPYMPPIVKDCTGKRGSKCFASQYKNVSGESVYQASEWGTGCKAIFSDGVAVSLEHIPWRNGLFQNLGTTYGLFYIDLNGGTKPNVVNKDLFNFTLVEKGVIPTGDANFSKYTWPPEITIMDYSGGRTAWVVYNGNMDYLRCPDKLSWNGAHTCKEAEKKK